MFSFLVLAIQTQSQRLPKDTLENNIVISIVKNKSLFLDRLNMVSIKTTSKTKDSLIIELSQGDIFGKDHENIYYIKPSKIGDLTINVFKQLSKTGKKLLLIKTFRVELTEQQEVFNNLSTKPNISLNGYLNGNIPFNTLKAIRCLTINPNYKFISAEIYISGCTAFPTSPYKLKSLCFDNDLLNLWGRISPGASISFDNLRVIDLVTKKTIYIPTINFLAVDYK